jgi:hypothetical protein
MRTYEIRFKSTKITLACCAEGFVSRELVRVRRHYGDDVEAVLVQS